MEDGSVTEYIPPVNEETVGLPQETVLTEPEVAGRVDEEPEVLSDTLEGRQQHEAAAEEMLARLEAENSALDREVGERYGEGFIDRVKEKGKGWLTSMEVKGNELIEYAEKKGIPIPKTRVGLRIMAGTMGAAGVVVPGLGVMLPAAYLLWKRAGSMENEVPLGTGHFAHHASA